MKLVFCLWSERGHVNPFIGPAQALQARGHDVVVTSTGDLSAQMSRSGLRFSGDLVVSREAPRGKALVEMLEDPEMQRHSIERFFIGGIADEAKRMQPWLAAQRPDAVVVDPMNYPAIIAAHLLDLPWISMSSSLTSVLPDGLRSPVRDMVDLVAPKRDAVFREFGFLPRFRAVDCLSPLLNITFATEDFVGPPPAEVELVGASRPIGARGDEVPMRGVRADRPIVYASFGSQVFHYPEIFRKIRAAAAPLNVHLILSIGDMIHDFEWAEDENVQLYEYAPQLQILQRASAFITHGGANSVMEGLVAGVPLLVGPLVNDQEHQAYFVEKSGVGLALDLKTASVEQIRESLVRVLEDPAIKSRMQQVSVGYQANGALKAAELILEACPKWDMRLLP